MSFHQLLAFAVEVVGTFSRVFPKSSVRKPTERKESSQNLEVVFFLGPWKNIMTRWLFKTCYSILVVRFHFAWLWLGEVILQAERMNEWMADLKKMEEMIENLEFIVSRSNYQQHHPLPGATTWDMSKKKRRGAAESYVKPESSWAWMKSDSKNRIHINWYNFLFESTVKHWKTQNVRYVPPLFPCVIGLQQHGTKIVASNQQCRDATFPVRS